MVGTWRERTCGYPGRPHGHGKAIKHLLLWSKACREGSAEAIVPRRLQTPGEGLNSRRCQFQMETGHGTKYRQLQYRRLPARNTCGTGKGNRSVRPRMDYREHWHHLDQNYHGGQTWIPIRVSPLSESMCKLLNRLGTGRYARWCGRGTYYPLIRFLKFVLLLH